MKREKKGRGFKIRKQSAFFVSSNHLNSIIKRLTNRSFGDFESAMNMRAEIKHEYYDWTIGLS